MGPMITFKRGGPGAGLCDENRSSDDRSFDRWKDGWILNWINFFFFFNRRFLFFDSTCKEMKYSLDDREIVTIREFEIKVSLINLVNCRSIERFGFYTIYE